MEWASLVSQLVQSLTAMQETRVRFLGREDPLDGHEFEQTPEIGDGQGSLACAFHGVSKSWT